MSWIVDFYRSPMGKKAVMALTGLALFGFVLGHMLGNLKLYAGRYESGPHAGLYALDVYAEGLRELGAPFFGNGQALWVARIGLLVALAFHVHCAWSLWRRNEGARPVRYARWDAQGSDFASRTMRWGGVIILLFVGYHLLHLTFGTVHQDFVPGAVHHNVVVGFRNPVVSAFYVAANLALGFHLYHGLWSLFQTLGWTGRRLDVVRRRLAAALAAIVTVGNVSFPIAVLTGLVS